MYSYIFFTIYFYIFLDTHIVYGLFFFAMRKAPERGGSSS